MKLTILLQDRKGKYVHHYVKDFPDIACLSDAAQQMSRYYIRRVNVFTFHSITNEDAVIFRQKEILECE